MIKKIDLTGKKIGKLEIIREINIPYLGKKNRKTILKLECRCLCGNVFYPYKTNVLTGKTTQCSRCQNTPDIIGKKIGELTVLSRNLSFKKVSYLCLCDCGNESIISSRYLNKGKFPQKCKKCRHFKKYSYKPKGPKGFILPSLAKKKHEDFVNSNIGKKINFLKVVSVDHYKLYKNKIIRYYYKCKCVCGNFCIIRGDGIKRTLSCGCIQKKRILKGENHFNSVLSNTDVKAIRSIIKSKLYTQKEVAKIFNVSEHVISNLITQKTYSSVE